MNDEFETTRRAFLNSVFHTGLASSVVRFGGLLSFTGFSAANAFGEIPAELPDNRSIFELQGNVLVDGQKADIKTFIKADALVETGSNSYIIFRVGKDAHILRENSRLQLEGSNILETGFQLLTGKILSVFGERQEKEKHTLRTSTATIGIRGTGVYAESDSEKSYLCTCYGQTEIRSDTDPGQSEIITATHHDAPRFILKDPDQKQLIVPAPVFNHTDEELMLIEAIVGRKAPISSVRSYRSPRRGY